MALSDDVTARVGSILNGRWPDVSVTGLREFTGGASSLTYAATLVGGPAERVVVKVAPPGLAPVRNRDVLRQAALLDRLAGHPVVRVPQVYGCDGGAPPEVPPLFVMSFEPGDSAEPLQVASDLAPEVIRSRALHAARMLAALHQVDVADLAKAAVTPRAEAEGWLRALATVRGDIRAGAADSPRLLLDRLPDSDPIALSHGDWRLGNTLCIGGEIRSVIDWEIWSVGDPRVDLAWFLMECDPTHPAAIAGGDTGMPMVDELLEEYQRALGRPVADLSWFRALVAIKQAAIIGLIAKNSAKRGVAMEPLAARMSTMLAQLLDWAASFLSAGTPS